MENYRAHDWLTGGWHSVDVFRDTELAESIGRTQMMAKNYRAALLSFITICVMWIVTVVVWLWTATPPMILFSDKDSMEPTIIRPGDTFYVTRVFTVTRSGPIKVTRSFEDGDCRSRCRHTLFTSETSYLEEGYYHRARQHVMPSTMQAGDYRFLVVVTWEDLFGRDHSLPMKPLPFTVVSH